jgi:hypothetical protein
MRIPVLPFSPEDLLRYPKHAQLSQSGGAAPSLTRIAELHDVVRTGTLREVEDALTSAGYVCNVPNIGVLFMTIETSTGNSLMHTAILAQRLDVMDALRYHRTHNVAVYRMPFYALWSHQRHDGDTILHSAVRSGNQQLVTAAFQVYRNEYFDAPDEGLQSADANGPMWDDYNEEESIMRIAELLFLLKLNAKGRTAAAEAQALGYVDIAAWLERAAQLDDPRRERDDPSVLQLWQDSCAQHWGIS